MMWHYANEESWSFSTYCAAINLLKRGVYTLLDPNSFNPLLCYKISRLDRSKLPFIRAYISWFSTTRQRCTKLELHLKINFGCCMARNDLHVHSSWCISDGKAFRVPSVSWESKRVKTNDGYNFCETLATSSKTFWSAQIAWSKVSTAWSSSKGNLCTLNCSWPQTGTNCELTCKCTNGQHYKHKQRPSKHNRL